MDSQTPAPAQPRRAATVAVLADTAEGVKVCMLRRHARARFASDMWVFPGGVVDAADQHLGSASWRGIDPQALAERFAEDPRVVLGLHVAAVRETFEEAGLLLATRPVSFDEDLRNARAALADRDRDLDLGAWLARRDAVLDLGGLAYLSRWVTPAAEPRRYDTCFFVARAPRGQIAAHDGAETTDQRWLTPREALREHAGGTLALMPPTIATLDWLRAHDTADEAIAAARAQAEVHSVRPRLERGPDGWRAVLPDGTAIDGAVRR